MLLFLIHMSKPYSFYISHYHDKYFMKAAFTAYLNTLYLLDYEVTNSTKKCTFMRKSSHTSCFEVSF